MAPPTKAKVRRTFPPYSCALNEQPRRSRSGHFLFPFDSVIVQTQCGTSIKLFCVVFGLRCIAFVHCPTRRRSEWPYGARVRELNPPRDYPRVCACCLSYSCFPRQPDSSLPSVQRRMEAHGCNFVWRMRNTIVCAFSRSLPASTELSAATAPTHIRVGDTRSIP